jgi:hypothetical protein
MKVEINKEYTFKEDQFLWRYMDLHRLIYFLSSQNIFFSPLSNFFDPLEGITEKHLHDKRYVDALDKKSDEEQGIPKKSKEKLVEEKKELKQQFKSNLEEIQKTYFASCWYLGVRESLAMWDSYSNKDSVALKFKPDQLCKLIIDSCKTAQHEDFDIMVHGKVEYYKISPFDPNDNNLKNCGHKFKGFLKDLSYKHEEEFRFLVMQNNDEKTFNFFELSLNNLKDIDFEIVSHPYMEPWKHSNIEKILKVSGLEHKLGKSEIPTRRQVFDTP